jgi:transposase-like protein
MTKHSHTWFFRFSKRNGGDLAAVSEQTHNTILEHWATGKTKAEIASMLDLHPNTIRNVTRQAREKADPRGFAKMKPKLMASCDSVIELRNYAWFVKGLAERLECHYTQAEALINDVIEDVKAKASK